MKVLIDEKNARAWLLTEKASIELPGVTFPIRRRFERSLAINQPPGLVIQFRWQFGEIETSDFEEMLDYSELEQGLAPFQNLTDEIADYINSLTEPEI